MDVKFLREVQAKGWHVEAATETAVIAKCPSVGCNLRAKLACNAHIPEVDPNKSRGILDRKVEKYDDIREILRARREGLALTIREIEEISGIAVDHLAKMEKDDFRKQPNAQTLIEWAQALGFELVLRPIDMPIYALRTICDTRDKLASRSKRFSLENRRRGSV